MEPEIKRMSVKEFRELGYLQELNRQFLHPLGLAIEVVINDETGKESFGEIWDCREDPEGITYGLQKSTIERNKKFSTKAEFVESERIRINKSREQLLGFDVEPITEIDT
jgi:hypothetical protein